MAGNPVTRIPERLPAALSERLSLASQAIYSRMGREVDVAVGGIPFMLATSSEVPQSIETIAVRKDQLDSEKDPGEQSLSGWWRRSQSSFHQGAGFLYEPNSDDPHEGYWDSENVEVFNQGDLTLLPSVSRISNGKFTHLRTYRVSGTRTNLCPNPSAETDITGWVGVGATLSRVTTQAFSGSASVRVLATGGVTAAAKSAPATVTVGSTYTVSAYVYVPAGAPNVFLAIGGFTDFIGTSTSTKGAWVRLQETSTASAGTVTVEVHSSTPPAAGQEFFVDAVLVEELGVVGSYFDGNSTGGAWTGTTNNSTSTLTIGNGDKRWSGCLNGRLYWDNAGASHLVGGKTIVDGLVSGAFFYDVASDGTLYQGLLSSPGTASSWPCGAAATRLSWGKHRLWVIGGRRLWQPDLSLVSGSAQTPVFIHPNQGWTYTCMAEGPAAMFFGGHDGQSSTIQAITLDSGGGLPTLSGAAASASLPDGELVQELAVVAGQFIGIGTTAGFRVGLMDGSNITYGPLMIEPDGVVGTTALVADGRFFLVAFETGDGLSQVYKVDTATEISTGVYAYAKDMRCALSSVDSPNKGTIVSLAVRDNNTVLAAAEEGLYTESSTGLAETGWLQTSRIRYRTTEPKSFKYLSVDMEPVVGSVAVTAILEGGSEDSLGTISQQGEVFAESFSIMLEPMRYMSLRFNFARQTSTTGPMIHSFLLRATPAARPQRLITLPLLCYDKEQAKSGQRYGRDGYANDRLVALQQLEDEARTLVFQDFTSGLDTGANVSIESMKFVQMTPRDSSTGNMGGILYLQLRTVDA